MEMRLGEIRQERYGETNLISGPAAVQTPAVDLGNDVTETLDIEALAVCLVHSASRVGQDVVDCLSLSGFELRYPDQSASARQSPIARISRLQRDQPGSLARPPTRCRQPS